jgi:competence protein ComEC
MKRRRPALLYLGAVWAGVLIGDQMGIGPLPYLAGLGTLAVLAVFWRGSATLAGLILAFALAGVLRSPVLLPQAPTRPYLRPGASCPLVADVRRPTLAALTSRPDVVVERVRLGPSGLEGRRVRLCGMDLDSPVPAGGFTVGGRFSVPRRDLNPYAPDRFRFMERRGLAGWFRADHLDREPQGGVLVSLDGLKTNLARMIEEEARGDAGGFLKALLLGERADLSAGVAETLVGAGTYHIIAVSGLHVGIVLLLAVTLLGAAGLGRRWKTPASIGMILVYTLFTGARASVQRAFAFFALVSVLRSLEWKVDVPNCCCLAGTILLLVHPQLAWDLGFKLSLAAVSGITLLVPQIVPPISRRAGRPARFAHTVLTGMAASFSAQVFALPLVLYYFGRASYLAPLSNILVLPLVTLILASGLEALFLLPLAPGLARILVSGASLTADACLDLNRVLAAMAGGPLCPGRPAPALIAGYSVFVAYLTLARTGMRKWLKVLILTGSCLCLVVFTHPAPEATRITFLYVGDGDACLVESPGGQTLLVDAGAAGVDFDAAASYVLPLLRLRGIGRIDRVVITHSHNDHYGGLAGLLEAVEVGEVLIGAASGEGGYVDLLERLRASGIPLSQVAVGDTFALGEVVCEVLHPDVGVRDGPADDPNLQSVVVMLRSPAGRVLLTGDLTPGGQRQILESGRAVRCDVLKAPHHGASHSLDAEFAESLGARWAVISAGTRFRSHPSEDTLDLLKSLGMEVLCTKWTGAVTVLLTDPIRVDSQSDRW